MQGQFLAVLVELLRLPGRQAQLDALGALHPPPQVGQMLGYSRLEMVGGAPLLLRVFDQGGEVGGVLAQSAQGLLAPLGIIPVTQIGGAGALLALRRGRSARLAPVRLVRRLVLFGHFVLLDERHKTSKGKWLVVSG